MERFEEAKLINQSHLESDGALPGCLMPSDPQDASISAVESVSDRTVVLPDLAGYNA